MSFSQMPDSPAAMFAIVLEVALKGTLLLVLAAMTAFILRNATASLRHLLWSVALIAMLAIPALTLVLPRWNLGLVPAPAGELITRRTDALPRMTDRLPPLDALSPMHDAALNVTPQMSSAGHSNAAEHVAASSEPSNTGTLAGSLALLWIGGLCAGLITIVGGMLALRRLAANAQALETKDWLDLRDQISHGLGITREVTLLRSDSAAMPATWGFLKPVVLLPSNADEWSDERRRVVLLHELAHVSRNDFLMQLVAQVCCAVYWFHPAVWYTARQLRAERELACDEHVLELGVNACDYAAHLLEIARVFRAPAGSGIAAIAMARPSQLEGRVLAILDGDTASRRRSSRRARVAAIAGLALISLPLAAMQPWAGEDWRDEGESGIFAPENSSAVVQSADDEAGLGTGAGTGTGTGEGAGTGLLQSEPLVWKGRVPAGKWVEIVVEYGEIRAELASGSEVEVYARQKNGDAKAVRIDRAQGTSGMTFCAMSSRMQPGAKMCAVDQMGRLNAQLRDIRVDWVVKVPVGVGIAAHTGRGNIAAEGLRSYVWGTSTRGDIAITTTDLAEASTGAGSISAEFGRRTWKQNLEFLTESGDVTVVAPSDAGMVIEGWTKSGVLESEFPGRIRPFESGQRMFTTIGRGGGALTLQSGKGKVVLKRGKPASGATSAMEASTYDDAPSTGVDPKPNPNPDPAYDPDPNPDPGFDPDPNVNPHVDFTEEDPTGERVSVIVPRDLLSKLAPERMRNAPDAKAIERIRSIALMHVKKHPADLVTERALWALTIIDDGKIVEPLKLALSSNDWKVRAYAAWALGEANDSRGTDRLIVALRDSHWRVRMHAASALQRLGTQAAVAPLIAVLSDEYWQVRISAVDALARIGDRRAVSALNDVANRDPREMVRDEARSALQRMR
jgi:beta-lactamase regulating signal transducer with metallopeptidase domain